MISTKRNLLKHGLLALLAVSSLSLSSVAYAQDTDGDGIDNILDLDDDNDGILDTAEILYCDAADEPIAAYGETYDADSEGNYKNQMLPFDFSGLTVAAGETKEVTRVYNGVTYTATISDVNYTGANNSSTTIAETVLGANNNALVRYYSGYSGADSLFIRPYNGTATYDITFKAEKNGVTLPVTVAVWEAQVTQSPAEKTVLTTSGSNFSLLESVNANGVANPDLTGKITGDGTDTVSYLETRLPTGAQVNAVFTTSSTGELTITNSSTSNNSPQQKTGYAIRLYCDTDSDGTPNFLDLDSDGDGCPDAIEGGDNVAASDLNTDGRIDVGTTSPFDVDSDGVPTIVNNSGSADADGAQAQTIGQSQDGGKNDCVDSDGDGVPNWQDLDSDNDGILDAAEKTFCGENDFQAIGGTGTHKTDVAFFDWSGLSISGAELNSGDYASTFTHNGVTYTAAISEVERSRNYPIRTAKMEAYGPAYAHKKYNPAGTTDAISFAFSGATAPQTGKMNITVTATKGGVSYPVEVLVTDAQVTNNSYNGVTENLAFTTSGTSFTLFEELGGTAGDTDAITGEGTQSIDFVNTRIEDASINSRNALFSTSGNESVELTVDVARLTGTTGTQAIAVAVVLYCDVDDDGIPNYLDLDSDNDGCADAIEGGGNVAASDLNTDGSINVGTDLPFSVDSDGVPTIVNNDGSADADGSQGQSIAQSQTAAMIAFDITAINGGEPKDVTIQIGASGQSATFTAAGAATTTTAYTSSGTPDYSGTTGTGTVTYQWQISTDNGSTWADISGATSASYAQAGVTAAMDGNQYQVIVSCAENQCATVTASATLTVNQVPVANDDSATTNEDTPVSGNVLTDDSDADGDSLSVTTFTVDGVSGTFNAGDTATIPGVGTLFINADGFYTFIPVENYNGTVPTATYTISDGNGGTDTATLDITVKAVNDPLVLSDDSTSTDEDTPVSGTIITSEDYDPDGTDLTVNTTPVSGPSNGTITLNADGTYTYTPNANWSGTDTVVIEVCDSGTPLPATCKNQTLTITVDAVNDIPVAVADTQTVPEDTPVNGVLLNNDSDTDDDTLTVTQITIDGVNYPIAAGGSTTQTISGVGEITVNSDGTYTFTPADNYTGDIPVVGYTISDGNGGSASSTLTLTMSPTNDIPTADNANVDTTEDTASPVPLSGTDVEDPASDLTYNIVSIPPASQATLTYDNDGDPSTPAVPLTAGTTLTAAQAASVEITPASNYTGSIDPVNYVAIDTAGSTSSVAQVTFNDPTEVNDAPIADNDTITAIEDTPVGVPLNGSDVDGTVTTYTITQIPTASEGTLTYTDSSGVVHTVAVGDTLTPAEAATVIFTPVNNYTGTVTPVQFTVTDDDNAISDVATINILGVVPQNDAPVANNANMSLTEDVATPIATTDFTATDVDGTIASYTIASVPDSSQATITFTRDGVETTLTAGETLTPAEAATLSIITAPNYTGPIAPLVYTATDNEGASSQPAQITFNTTDVNDAPIADNASVTPTEDTPADVPLNGSDVDGTVENVMVTAAMPSSQGRLVYDHDGDPNTATVDLPLNTVITVAQAATVGFIPTENYTGPVTDVVFKVQDDDGAWSEPAVVTIANIIDVNDVPTADDASIAPAKDTPVSVPLNGDDVDGDVVYTTITSVPPSSQGTVVYDHDGDPSTAAIAVVANTPMTSAQAATVQFVPTTGYTGSVDPITFTVTDNDGAVSDPATISIAPIAGVTVSAPDNTTDTTPTITGTSNLPAGTPLTVVITDSNGDTQTVTTTVASDGTYSVTPSDSLPIGTYTVVTTGMDSNGNTVTANDSGSVVKVPTVSVSAPDNTTDSTPTITGSSDATPGSTVSVVITDSAGNTQTLTATVQSDGSYSVTPSTALALGNYTATATVTDSVTGLTATTTDDGSITSVPVSPTITVATPGSTTDTTPTITGTTNAAVGSTVTLVVTDSAGNTQTLTATVQTDGTYSANVTTPLAAGAYTVVASVNGAVANGGGAVITTATHPVPSTSWYGLLMLMFILVAVASRRRVR